MHVSPRGPRPHNDQDHRLIRQVAAGDLAAFDILYQHYAPKLYGYLTAQLGQPELAEEVSQDVLLAVWHQAGQFRQASRLSTWIYGIAWRMAHKARTCIPTHNTMALSLLNEGSEQQEPAIALEYQEYTRAIARGIDTLPQPLRRTLILRYYHDYTYQQIAQEMDCTEDTVNRWLRHGRRRLRGTLRRMLPLDVMRCDHAHTF